MELSHFLKSKRKSLNLSVKDVQAFLQSHGVIYSDKSIYGWENGRQTVNADTFLLLCSLYKIESFSEILGSDDVLFTYDEYQLLEKYRALDERGKKAVDTILEQQYQETIGEKAQSDPLSRHA